MLRRDARIQPGSTPVRHGEIVARARDTAGFSPPATVALTAEGIPAPKAVLAMARQIPPPVTSRVAPGHPDSAGI
jgi:hypothetical protein